MANQAFSYINRAYEEVFDNNDRPQKNLHAFIGYIYPSPFIQVMEAFAPYEPLDQAFAQMDLESSSFAQKPFAWDEVASSSSGNIGWDTWSTPVQP